LLIVLDVVGGDAEAGLAVAEIVASMKKPVVSLLLGSTNSIGLPLAIAARKSYIVPSATVLVCPVCMDEDLGLGGNTLQERINKFIVNHSGIVEQDLHDFLLADEIGSIIDSETAKNCGLIDQIGGLSDAMQKLRAMCSERERNKRRRTKKSWD